MRRQWLLHLHANGGYLFWSRSLHFSSLFSKSKPAQNMNVLQSMKHKLLSSHNRGFDFSDFSLN